MEKGDRPFLLESGAIVRPGQILEWPSKEEAKGAKKEKNIIEHTCIRVQKAYEFSDDRSRTKLRDFQMSDGILYGLSEAIFDRLNIRWGDSRSNLIRRIIGRLLWLKDIKPVKTSWGDHSQTSVPAYYKFSDIAECLPEAEEIISAGADGIFLYKDVNEAKEMIHAYRKRLAKAEEKK